MRGRKKPIDLNVLDISQNEELIFVYFADRTVAFFEEPSDLIPVPSFAASFNLTVGQLFAWLTE